jgi:hypothetical protein
MEQGVREGVRGTWDSSESSDYCDVHALLRRAISSAWRRLGRGKIGVTAEEDQGFIWMPTGKLLMVAIDGN